MWRLTGSSMEQAGVTVGRLVQNVLPSAQSPPAVQQEALRRIAAGLESDVTLFAADGSVIAAIGHPLPRLGAKRFGAFARAHWDGSAVSVIHLQDGRVLVARVPLGTGSTRLFFHLMLVLLVAAIGVAAYPIVRQLTRRLERLQRGVESLGAGDLSARVAVEGRDEVARLAESFNRAASQIEQLVRAHQTLLANASHELRTPLARIRLAVELLKASADAKSKAGLEQDIAELDWLVDEILLASRLDAVNEIESREEIDLLALAAEECSRYDDVHLEGSPVGVHGDARLLRRLLRNLLENARRHGIPPTQVRVTSADGTAVVTVWDNGPGPLQSEFEKVFKPFYRSSASRTGVGTGLGLALVRQIAQRHGGDARCTVGDDGRSRFTVTLADKSAPPHPAGRPSS
ncbi:MAG: HAMP domain-containing histidine kinase [Proteobacteria bacterium]|nr:HAMP domain-containing histidine kinase [Pseudomonadota bacterium]